MIKKRTGKSRSNGTKGNGNPATTFKSLLFSG